MHLSFLIQTRPLLSSWGSGLHRGTLSGHESVPNSQAQGEGSGGATLTFDSAPRRAEKGCHEGLRLHI